MGPIEQGNQARALGRRGGEDDARAVPKVLRDLVLLDQPGKITFDQFVRMAQNAFNGQQGKRGIIPDAERRFQAT
jgi:hypothetical protein